MSLSKMAFMIEEWAERAYNNLFREISLRYQMLGIRDSFPISNRAYVCTNDMSRLVANRTLSGINAMFLQIMEQEHADKVLAMWDVLPPANKIAKRDDKYRLIRFGEYASKHRLNKKGLKFKTVTEFCRKFVSDKGESWTGKFADKCSLSDTQLALISIIAVPVRAKHYERKALVKNSISEEQARATFSKRVRLPGGIVIFWSAFCATENTSGSTAEFDGLVFYEVDDVLYLIAVIEFKNKVQLGSDYTKKVLGIKDLIADGRFAIYTSIERKSSAKKGKTMKTRETFEFQTITGRRIPFWYFAVKLEPVSYPSILSSIVAGRLTPELALASLRQGTSTFEATPAEVREAVELAVEQTPSKFEDSEFPVRAYGLKF